MTDAWNMAGGQVYVAPVGADPKDPSRWHRLGTLTEMEMQQDDGWCGGGRTTTLTTQGPVTLFKPQPVKTRPSVEFTFNTKPFSLDALALYYGADVKAAGIVNNRGEARKEEKHMGVRKFEALVHGTKLTVEEDKVGSSKEGGVFIDLNDKAWGWFEKADVPLIAHALFEKSGWPDAVKDDDGEFVTAIGGQTSRRLVVGSEFQANYMLATAISALAAYNAWVEGAAARLEAEVAAEAARVEAEERRAAENARKREHDALRTSVIALEVLELYNAAIPLSAGAGYASWDEVCRGKGTDDAEVREYIAKAEAARAAKPAPKLGDRVRVSADAGVLGRPRSFFGGEVEGSVIGVDSYDGVLHIKAPTSEYPLGKKQYVDPKYVTVVATAEDLAAEKLKAERDAGIVDLSCVMGTSLWSAEVYYNRGIRATA